MQPASRVAAPDSVYCLVIDAKSPDAFLCCTLDLKSSQSKILNHIEMTNKKLPPMTGITLQGFQVFEKLTYIPLRELTLIYGPNSAGKSAIDDAIALHQKLLNPKNYIYTDLTNTLPFLFSLLESDWRGWNDDVSDLIEKNWRRSCADSSVVSEMLLGADSTTVCHLVTAVAGNIFVDIEFHENPEDYPYTIGSRWRFKKEKTTSNQESEETEENNSSWSYELQINGKKLISHEFSQGVAFDFSHFLGAPFWKIWDWTEACRLCPALFSIENRVLRLKHPCPGLHPGKEYKDNPSPSWQQWFIFGYKEFGIDQCDNPDHIFKTLDLFSILTENFLSTTNGNSALQYENVPASRRLPARKELISYFGEWGNDEIYDLVISSEEQPYSSLAESLASEKLKSQYIPKSTPQFAIRVNHALGHHLFLDNGYQIDFEYRILLSAEESKDALNNYKLDTSELRYIVEIFLRDNQGRKLRFDDVGTGIGYVLPVVCAAYSGSSTSFIQQPELHIHPALQAAIGDVFLEASHLGKQLLIETHSEHLLLRILKRVRQTHLQASIAPDLMIQADDVCILYFNPKADGTTEVKRIRVTEDGEFMDRWPRGFFMERDLELFDE